MDPSNRRDPDTARNARLRNDLWETVGSKIRAADDIVDGATVAVVRSSQADPVVSEIITKIAREKGATVTNHVYPSFDTWRRDLSLPTSIEKAIRNTDILISHPYLSAAQFQWSKTVFGAMIDQRLRHISFSPSARVLASPLTKWPHELAITVSEVLAERLFGKDRAIRITDERGSDITLTGSREVTHPAHPSRLRRAQPDLGADESPWGKMLRIFPTGEIGWHPFDTAEGTFVVDAMDGYGVLDDPITWHVADGELQDVTGGPPAEHFKAQLEQFSGTEHRNLLAEASFGFNPKATWDPNRRGLAGLLPKAGTFHLAMGISTNKSVPETANPTHIDALNRGPTVSVDGEIIMEDGTLHLLADLRANEQVREVAAKYGDPDVLLSEGETDW